MGWQDAPLVEEEEKPAKGWQSAPLVDPTLAETAKDIAKQVPSKLARGAVEIPMIIPRLGTAAAEYAAPKSDFAKRSRKWIEKTERSMGTLGLDEEAETTAGRYAGAVAEALPGFALPGVGFGGQIARGVATNIPGQVSRFRPIAQTLGGAAGAGVAGEAAADLGADPITRALASMAGGVGGALGAPRAAATAADIWFHPGGAVPLGAGARVPITPGVEPGTGNNPFARAQRAPGSPGGPVGPPRPPPPPSELGPHDPAAYDMLHRAMVQAGVPPERIPEAMAAYQQARTARANSVASGELSIMDVDPALQSMAGSVSRMSPEGANVIRPVITARQTGEPSAQLDPAMGVRTRPAGLRREDIPADQRRPSSGQPLPVGQHGHIDELLTRHLEIEDLPHHGLGTNARETGAMIAAQQADQASASWGSARAAAENVDIGADPGVQAAVAKWVARLNNPFTPAAEKALIKRALDNLAPGEGGRVAPTLQDFHDGKMIVDKMISPYYTGVGGEKNARLGAKLVELKNDIQGAVGRIQTNNVGPLYRKANTEFAGHETALDEMALGRQVWEGRGDKRIRAEEALQRHRDAESEALSRLAKARRARDASAVAEAADDVRAARNSIKRIKHGFKSAAMEESSAAQNASDRTRMFRTPDRQDDLSYMISRSKDPRGEFRDRPQRFYEALEVEEQKIQTRNKVLGGSPTQERSIRDTLFDSLHTLRDVFTQGPSAVIQRGAELAFERFFGMSAEVNVALARKLASTDPRIHAEAYRELSMRVGRSRAEIFQRAMEHHRRAITSGGLTAATPEAE